MVPAVLALLALGVSAVGDEYTLHRYDPVAVGHERTISIAGQPYVMRTISMKPAAFTIENFLTSSECDDLVDNVGGKKPSRGMHRESNQTWLDQSKPEIPKVLHDLRDRVYELVKLPRFLVEDGEPLQVLQYHPGGHYHTHHDSVPQTPRYLTMLYYLSDVEEGGETCFPLADTEFEQWSDDNKPMFPGPEDYVTEDENGKEVVEVEDRWGSITDSDNDR
jgi:hypothetical protein